MGLGKNNGIIHKKRTKEKTEIDVIQGAEYEVTRAKLKTGEAAQADLKIKILTANFLETWSHRTQDRLFACL